MGLSAWADTIRRGAAGAALVAIVVGGVGVGTYLLFASDDLADAPAAPRTPMASVAPPVPAANEFSVGVTVTGQNCARPDECVYTYTIEPKYVGMRPLPEQELQVHYRVSGGREPQDGTFTVHGREARYMKDVTVAGPAGATLTAAVLEVVQSPVYGPTVGTPPTSGVR
jgi:hypothetical protein